MSAEFFFNPHKIFAKAVAFLDEKITQSQSFLDMLFSFEITDVEVELARCVRSALDEGK
jgi:hypothetical protein